MLEEELENTFHPYYHRKVLHHKILPFCDILGNGYRVLLHLMDLTYTSLVFSEFADYLEYMLFQDLITKNRLLLMLKLKSSEVIINHVVHGGSCDDVTYLEAADQAQLDSRFDRIDHP